MQKKVRVRRAVNLILFVVDASWSMAGAQRMEATKGAIMSLLVDAYQKRDRVGLVVFQKEEARLVLPFTSSVDLAQEALRHLPVGGKTPLSAGLMLAYRVFRRELRLHPEAMPLMILLTDGAGNVSLTETPPQEEAHKIADLIRRAGIHSVVINMEHEAYDRGLASQPGPGAGRAVLLPGRTQSLGAVSHRARGTGKLAGELGNRGTGGMVCCRLLVQKPF